MVMLGLEVNSDRCNASKSIASYLHTVPLFNGTDRTFSTFPIGSRLGLDQRWLTVKALDRKPGFLPIKTAHV